MKRIKTGKMSLVCFASISLIVGLAWASPANWIEVARFTGSSDQDTDYFICSHAEWRINWTYTPNPNYPQFALFAFAAKDNATQSIGSVYQSGNQTTSGLTYIHNKIGQFYLSITPANLLDYTIIVEQDLDSIPEYPLGFIFTLLAATFFIAIVARRLRVPS